MSRSWSSLYCPIPFNLSPCASDLVWCVTNLMKFCQWVQQVPCDLWCAENLVKSGWTLRYYSNTAAEYSGYHTGCESLVLPLAWLWADEPSRTWDKAEADFQLPAQSSSERLKPFFLSQNGNRNFFLSFIINNNSEHNALGIQMSRWFLFLICISSWSPLLLLPPKMRCR